MTYDKALQVLGLSNGFSEEELKRAYRMNARKWHPDVNKTSFAGEMFNEIHDAYECLKNNKHDFFKHVNNGLDFALYKVQVLNNIQSYNDGLYKLTGHSLNSVIFNFVNSIKYYVNEYTLIINRCSTISQLEDVFNQFTLKIKEQLINFRNDYYKRYPYLIFVNPNINFDLSPYNFVLELDNVNKDVVDKIKKEIRDKIVNKYSLYAGYSDIADEIELYISETTDDILNNMKLKEEYLNRLYERIDFLFDITFKESVRRKEIDKLLEFINGIDSINLRNMVDELSDKCLFNDDFFDRVDHIMYIAKSIKSGNYIDAVKVHLTKQYTMSLSRNLSKKDKYLIESIYSDAMKLVDKITDGFINYDVLSDLFQIKFERLDIDKIVIDHVLSRNGRVNTAYAYVAKDTISTFGYLLMKDDKYKMMYKSTMGVNQLEATNISDVSQDFISLSMYLANAKFICKRVKNKYGIYLDLLYEYEGRCIVGNDKGVLFVVSLDDLDMDSSRDITGDLREYKDRRLVLAKVEQKIKNDYLRRI